MARILALLLVALILLARPVPVSAHAVLLASYPSDGGVLTAPPASVHLWFSGPVQAIAHSITVVDPSGHHVERGAIRDDGVELSIAVHAAKQGTYLVSWSVISDDTHPASGRFVFSVGHTGGPFGGVEGASGTVPPLGLGLQAAPRLLHAAGYALGFGPFVFGLLASRRRARLWDAPVERRLRRLITAGIVLLLLAEPLALLAQTASLGTGAMLDPDVTTAVMASSFGRVLAQQIGAAVLLWALAGVVKPGAARGTGTWAVLLLGLALALIDGEAGHAIGSSPVWVGLGANAIHIAAMGA